MAGAIVGAASLGTLAPGLCATIIGCAAVSVAGAALADQAITGYREFVTGRPRTPAMGEVGSALAIMGPGILLANTPRLTTTLFSLTGSGPRASAELLDAMQAHGRTITFARQGSEELRFLNTMGAEASVGGPNHLHIVLRENPSRAAALEEFLHGTQFRLGIMNRLGVQGAEMHVQSFMQRHFRLLGLE
jgi:hypothetical protein